MTGRPRVFQQSLRDHSGKCSSTTHPPTPPHRILYSLSSRTYSFSAWTKRCLEVRHLIAVDHLPHPTHPRRPPRVQPGEERVTSYPLNGREIPYEIVTTSSGEAFPGFAQTYSPEVSALDLQAAEEESTQLKSLWQNWLTVSALVILQGLT